jgi:hypothetical protein
MGKTSVEIPTEMIVVTNSGPLMALAKLGLLDLLGRLYGKVYGERNFGCYCKRLPFGSTEPRRSSNNIQQYYSEK